METERKNDKGNKGKKEIEKKGTKKKKKRERQ